MPVKIILSQALLILSLIIGVIPAGARETSVKAKQFPTGYFSQYHKIPIQEKTKVLAKIDATLKKLTQGGFGLIAKGAVIEKPDPGIMTYPQLTILDESGLVIIARRVPNLFYQYRGKAGINPNIYIIIKGARVNIPESYIRYSYVVEGEFVAYANKFVSAVLEGLERPAAPQGRQPARPAP
ncbi:MAG: hypothetical protein KKD99_07740 [Proteobacteria bacterium]|nr:hypothetical protein [Pseudomonadota bacterium]MBU4354557.1 hypothetical protein [Pseudomonadota bacterium]MBU4448462.1 hypothetical protein [Pseudomonadota bacterium]MCG2770505.1 hypothetical protein [Desulfobacterales bacterium]